MKVLAATVAAVALAAAGVSYAIASSGGPPGVPPGFDTAHSDLLPRQAAEFARYPLYSLGDAFEGLPLRAIARRTAPAGPREPDPVDYVAFLYGDCVPDSDSGCPLPVEVQVWPACARTRADYTLTPAGDPFPREDMAVRGVPAARFPDGRVELYTGGVTVVVFGNDSAQVLRAARAVRGVNRGLAAEAPLPAPVAGALDGALSCD